MNLLTLSIKDTASIDVDAQKTFTPLCPNELPVPGGDEIADLLNDQAAIARLRLGSKDAHSASAVWIADEQHPPLSPLQEKNLDVYWPAHAVVGTPGFELLNRLPHPTEYDFFVWKGVEPDMHPYGACYHDFATRLSTGVIEFLETNSITTVLVGGLALEYCVKETALQLVNAGFRVIVHLAATRPIAQESGQAAISTLQEAGIIVIDSLDVLDIRS